MVEPTPTLRSDARRAQAYPTLTTDEVLRMRRFAEPRHFAAGDRLYETGKTSPGMFLVLSGSIQVIGRDGHGRDIPLVEHGAGAFSGEIGQLSGKRAFVDGIAVGEVDALLIIPAQLRALLVAEAALGEKIMRALILRRVSLLEIGAGGPTLIGSAASPRVAQLRNFLSRNSIPHMLLDPTDDADARAFVAAYTSEPGDLPLAICPDGSVLRNPSENELARCIGMLDLEDVESTYDVVIVGAGPAGLATAVYAASEGLSTLVLDARAFGGQAGASSRIENYLGFPTGISGQALAARAHNQAQKFGARMLIPAEVTRLSPRRDDNLNTFDLKLSDGRTVRGRSVVIATGARYRRPECSDLQTMEGNGVWYWASHVEVKMCAGEDVVLVGGGNSAGQAAVFLATQARKIWMLVRDTGLAASMSRYLVDRISAASNIEVRPRTELVGIAGSAETGIESVRSLQRDTEDEETHVVRHVFLFLGADPATEWLRECPLSLDRKGFVVTGSAPSEHAASDNPTPMSLETSIPGVFAVGDVRLGSVKRVGGAIGEGAAVAAQIHAFLAASRG